MKPAVALLALTLCLGVVHGEIWAVLLAGSNQYYNYRHQADICHAYHVLTEHGVDEDNIILFAYDDIAHNSQNPFPGQIFNKPATSDGVNVYEDCNIDYKGDEVNVKNYLAVLKGDSETTGGKPVLNSTSTDHVFLNFADHGGTGIIEVVNDFLYADQLLDAISYMHENSMYERLVYYMEACESGSMFVHLPTDINVYAATAANPDQSSWGCYCPPDDKVDGKELNTCLGDTFSVSWMQNSDANNLHTETLEEQFKEILPLVTQSNPQQYGTKTWVNEDLCDYMGFANYTPSFTEIRPEPIVGQVDGRSTKLISLRAMYESNPNEETFQAYMEEIKSMESFDTLFEKIDGALGLSPGTLLETPVNLPYNLDCLRNAVNTFQDLCARFTDYSLRYVKNLANLCYTYDVTDFESLFGLVC